MRLLTYLLSLLSALPLITHVVADEKATSHTLPMALAELGVGEGDIVSTEDAARVRGSWAPLGWAARHTHRGSSSGHSPGSIVIVDGIVGRFYYRDVYGLEAEGVFGGQGGFFRTLPTGGIQFGFEGKAVRTEIFFNDPGAMALQQRAGH